MGWINGVVARLKRLYEKIFTFGCYAHKLALWLCAALQIIVNFLALEKLIKLLITWARKSPKRARRLAQIATETENKFKKLGLIHCTRWLSREIVISQILDSVLVSLAGLHQGLNEVKKLHAFISRFQMFFILYLSMI